MARWFVGRLVCVASLVVLAGCSEDSSSDGDPASEGAEGAEGGEGAEGDGGAEGGETPAETVRVLLSGEGNNLNIYNLLDGSLSKRQLSVAGDRWDINGQFCPFPDNPRRFIGGEDLGQTRAGGDEAVDEVKQGWAIWDVTGDSFEELDLVQYGKLIPTYQPTDDSNFENYGCGVLPNGNIVTTDLGEQALGEPTGQLILWFPPFDVEQVAFCKIDIAIPTAMGVYVDGDDVYVASARGVAGGERTAGIYRYSGQWPTSADADGGCGRTDGTGAALVDEGRVSSELFYKGLTGVSGSPHQMVPTGSGTFYVSSSFDATIAEVSAEGQMIRMILEPAEDDDRSADASYATGDPVGLAIDADGNLYYAGIGLVQDVGFPGPGDNTGTVNRIPFAEDGEDAMPMRIDEGLAFPDGLGILSF